MGYFDREQNCEIQVSVAVTYKPYCAPSGGPTLHFRDLNVHYRERTMVAEGSHGPQYGQYELERIFSIPHEFAKLTVSCHRPAHFQTRLLWHDIFLVAELISSDSAPFREFVSAEVIPYGQRGVLRDRESIALPGALVDYVLHDACTNFSRSIIDICNIRDALTDVLAAPNVAEQEKLAALVTLSIARFLTERSFIPALLVGDQEVALSPLATPRLIENQGRSFCTQYVREALDMILVRKKS